MKEKCTMVNKIQMPVLKARLDGRWEVYLAYCHVPRGFVTDGASVPRLLWRVCGHPMEAPAVAAAVMHDWDYAAGKVPRDDADRRFRENLALCGVGFARRWLFWLAVRLFGRRRYARPAREGRAPARPAAAPGETVAQERDPPAGRPAADASASSPGRFST